jgi:DNA-binding cell septation regulator SpoVG
MDIEVLGIRVLDNGKPLKAFVDVQLDNFIIRDWRVIQQNGCKAYVTSPQIVWKGAGGINFKPIVKMPNELMWQVESAILAKYQRQKGEENGRGTS